MWLLENCIPHVAYPGRHLDITVTGPGKGLEYQAKSEGSWKGLGREATWSAFCGSYTLWPPW